MSEREEARAQFLAVVADVESLSPEDRAEVVAGAFAASAMRRMRRGHPDPLAEVMEKMAAVREAIAAKVAERKLTE